MKVIIWAPFGAGTHYWGPGTSAFRLFNSLNDDNVKLVLVHGSELQGDFPDVYDEQVKLGSIDNKSIISTLIFLIKSFFWIYKNKNKYDVFYGLSAFYYTFLPALLFNKYKGKTYIKITGASGGFSGNGLLSRVSGFSRFRLRSANAISGYISISTRIKSNLLNCGIRPELIFNIPNGVNVDRFVPVDIDNKLSVRKEINLSDKFTFLYLGGLTENKRVGNIIKSASILKTKYKLDFQVVIVGPDRSNGVVLRELEKLVINLSLNDDIVFINNTNKPELYLQAADVYVLISKTEGMPNSLLEAMSCGLPAIVTKVSGSEDLILNNENGVFTCGEPDELASIMHDYMGNDFPLGKFGGKSRDIIINGYSSEAIVNKHIETFKNDC